MNSILVIVIIVLGLIVAGGFLLYIMGDIFMGMATKKNRDEEAIRKRQIEENKKLEDRLNALENSELAKSDPAIATILYNGGMVEAYDPEKEELDAQGSDQEKPTNEFEEEVKEFDDAEKAQEVEESEEISEEEVDEEQLDQEDVSDYIARRRAELMEKLARIREESETEEEDDSINLDEEETEEVEESNSEETEEADEETVEDIDEEVNETVEERVETETFTSIANVDMAEVEAKIVANVELTVEELEAKLIETQERLRANEKELRQCKKEYIPLRKVKKTLENDEKKLRRKEALVAKQKVVLYGVNNYADIDEEKAKKLAEDLDLLDGLKLSVQHCHEVMDKNEERYPLLEQIYNLLVAKNAELKEQIKDLQERIDKANK